MCRNNTILYGRLVNQQAILILPCYSITILSGSECCFVGCITSNSHYCRRPTCKGVCVFRCILFYRICMSRNLSILNNCLVDQGAIFILPCNGITILGSKEGSLVSCITRNCHNRRSPTCKCVGVFCRILFCRICMSRDLSILYGRLVNQ